MEPKLTIGIVLRDFLCRYFSMNNKIHTKFNFTRGAYKYSIVRHGLIDTYDKTDKFIYYTKDIWKLFFLFFFLV